MVLESSNLSDNAVLKKYVIKYNPVAGIPVALDFIDTQLGNKYGSSLASAS